MKQSFLFQIYKKVITHINGWVDFCKFSETFVFFTNHKYIISLLFIFLLEIILTYYSIIVINNNYFYFVISNVSVILCFYWVLYSWRNIPWSFFSFMRFFINTFFFTIMLGVILKIICGLEKPLYINELPISAGIRYSIFIVLVIMGVSMSFFIKKINSSKLQDLYMKISFPYLMDETKIILATWENTFFGPLFEKTMYQMAYNNIKCFFIFSLHFILYYIIPLIQSLLLLNFAFFNGDFRYNLYFMPLSMLSWCFKHFWYYFNVFFNMNVNSIQQQIDVTYYNKIIDEQEFILVDTNKLECCLKHPTNDVNYNQHLLFELKKYFILLAIINVKLIYYKKITKYFPYVILSIRFFCWCVICVKTLFKSEIFFLTFPTIFSKNIFTKIVCHSYATEAFFIKKAFQKALENTTQGAYKKGHPITTDLEKPDADENVPFYHQPTHGTGLASNPSKQLSSQCDVEGNPAIQNAVYPEEKQYIPYKWLSHKIPFSKTFYERADVKANDAQNDKNFSSNEKD